MVGREFKHVPQLVIDWGRKTRNHFVPTNSTDPSFLNIFTMSCTSLRFSGDPMDEINFTTVTFGLISVIFTMAAGGNKGMAKECKGAKDRVAVKPESVRCFMTQAPVMPCVVRARYQARVKYPESPRTDSTSFFLPVSMDCQMIVRIMGQVAVGVDDGWWFQIFKKESNRKAPLHGIP